MSRCNSIVKRWIKLNTKSVQEGLHQLLDYTDFDIHQRRCLAMVMSLPNVEDFDYMENADGSVNVKAQPSNSIMVNAIEFCKQHAVDSTSCKVFVNNIDFKTKQHELWDFFEHFGNVLRVHIIKDRKTKRSRGFGFVVFCNPFVANKALNAKKYELKLNGRLMQVLPPTKKKNNGNTIQNTPEDAQLKLKEAADYFLGNKKEELLEKTSSKQDKMDEKEVVAIRDCTLIDKLCDNLLLEIFSYVCSDITTRLKLELVCKRWYIVAIQSWREVRHLHFKDVFKLNNMHALTDRILLSILHKGCQNLKTMDLSSSPYLITNKSLIHVAKVCHKLEEINLSHVPLKKDSAKELGKKLNLKKIHMSNCLNLGEKGYWWLFKDQVRLQELKITDTRRLIGNCLYMLPPTVTSINFASCSKLLDTGLNYLSMRCPNLSHLDLSFCLSISDSGLNILLEKCCNIRELKLKGLGRNVSLTGLMYITQLKHLLDLDISRSDVVNDDLLRSIVTNCKNLQKLNMEACHGDISSAGISALCFCHNLTELNISYIVNVTDECVSELALEGNLQKLIIRCSPEITDTCAAYCLQFLDKLQLLDLSGCFYISDDLVSKLDLKYVDRSRSENEMQIILGGTQVTEEGISMLQKKLTFAHVTMQNFYSGMLRNDRDPTLVRSFFPESSDEDDDGGEDEKVDLVVLKPDIDFDILKSYPRVDEDGERLWVSSLPSPGEAKNEQLDILATAIPAIPTECISNLQLKSVTSGEVDEENWDNEMEDGPVWCMTAESFGQYYPPLEDGHDDFLENDDVSRLELIG